MESLPFRYQKRDYWEYYCPICKVLRRTVYWPSPQRRHYISILGLAVFLCTVFWPWFGLKGLLFSLPIWTIFEFVYRARARQAMVCTHCGFDPYLYKYDVTLARQKVEEFFSDRKKKEKGTEDGSSSKVS